MYKTLNQTFHTLGLKEIPIIYFLLKLCLHYLKSSLLMHVTCLQVNPLNSEHHTFPPQKFMPNIKATSINAIH